MQGTSGAATFGVDAKTALAVTSYRPFSAGADAPTLLEAIQESLKDFVVPFDTSDLDAMTPGTVVTLEGHGTLKFSGSANLLAIANPLATLALPSPLPTLSCSRARA